MSLSYSNKFFLKPKSGSGRAKIFQRITVNRLKAELYTGLELEEKLWDSDSQRTKGNATINKRLSEKESELHNVIFRLELEKKSISAKSVKALLQGGADDERQEGKLLFYAKQYIAGRESDGELTARTIWGFKNLYDHLSKFVNFYIGQEDISMKEIDYNFLKSLDSYLFRQKAEGKATTLKWNTVNKHHVRLRTFLHAAVREGVLSVNPYATFRLKDTPSQRKYLSEEEVKQITEHDLGGNTSLQKVRDIFIWSVYTGLRFQDAMDVEVKQVRKDSEGNYSIHVYQNKTGESVFIPLLPPAVEIFERYDNEERKAKGKVLPSMSNQKVNTYLKVIGDLAGIDSPLTHHMARHTCATIFLNNGMSLEMVGRWLGHQDMRSTQAYAKITNQALMKAGKDMAEKLRKKE